MNGSLDPRFLTCGAGVGSYAAGGSKTETSATIPSKGRFVVSLLYVAAKAATHKDNQRRDRPGRCPQGRSTLRPLHLPPGSSAPENPFFVAPASSLALL